MPPSGLLMRSLTAFRLSVHYELYNHGLVQSLVYEGTLRMCEGADTEELESLWPAVHESSPL